MLPSQVQVSNSNCYLKLEACTLLIAGEVPFAACLHFRAFPLPSGVHSPGMSITLNLNRRLYRWQKALNYWGMCCVERGKMWIKMSPKTSHRISPTIRTASNLVVILSKV